jgi:transposase InsO family protein
MKYAFMESYSSKYPIRKMAAVFKVSRSGYYAYLGRDRGKRFQQRERYQRMVKDIFELNKGRYGSIRIADDLKERHQEIVSRQRVSKIMKHLHLQAKRKRHKKHPKPGKGNVAAANTLDQNFHTDSPNSVWVSDISYMYYRHGKAYLTVVLDLFNREPVGWNLSRSMHAENTVMPALKNAVFACHPGPGLLFHSDQGSQYHDAGLLSYMEDHDIKRSMSGKGCCYDNAVIESFFSTLKCELPEYREAETFDELELMLFEYIDGYYKNMRSHSYLNGLTPYEYKKMYYEKSTV